MKRVFFLAMMIVIVVSLATAKTPAKPITQDDLKDLKGEWTGERERVGIFNRTDLKIYNDSLPLRGEVTLHFEQRAAPKTWFFKNGRIENGRLIVVWSKDRSMDLRLRKGDGKMKLEGDITTMGLRCLVFFKKVQK